MQVFTKGNHIILKETDSFVISQTFECGQCFNFHKLGDEDYVITAHGRALHIYLAEEGIILENTTMEEYESVWRDYFDLAQDYSAIKGILSRRDGIIQSAIGHGPGIRILKQEFFQCLISFIISQNKSIPMIKQGVRNLSQRYGNPLGQIGGEEFYSFPSPESLYGVGEEELRKTKVGFRAKYIVDAVNRFVEGRIPYEAFADMTTEEVRTHLMEIKGVGPKVSDCVLLFSLGRQDAFPTDVWVKRVMSYFYFNEQDTPIETIHRYAYDTFGEYAGYAQQYLFNYAHNLKIKPKEEGK